MFCNWAMKSSVIVKCNCMTSLCCSRMRGCSETICLIDTAPIKTFPRPSLPFPELFSAPKTFSDPANPHRGAWGCNPSPPRKGAFSPRYLKSFQVPTLVISCFSYLYRTTTWNTKSVFNSPKIFPVNSFHLLLLCLGWVVLLCRHQVHLARKCLPQMEVDIEHIARQDVAADPCPRHSRGGSVHVHRVADASDIRPAPGRSWGPVGPTALADCTGAIALSSPQPVPS